MGRFDRTRRICAKPRNCRAATMTSEHNINYYNLI